MESYKYSVSQKEEKEWNTKVGTKKCNKQKTVTNMTNTNPAISVITLNINSLNILMERQRSSEEINKARSNYMLLTKATLNIEIHID